MKKKKYLWKGGFAWTMEKYKVRKKRNVGGDKHSAGHPLIAECMSNYETEQKLLKEKQETDKIISVTT